MTITHWTLIHDLAAVEVDRLNQMFSSVFGPFRRSFTLPATIDGSRVSAAFADGVLTITVPQREEAKPRAVEVH